MLLFTYNLVNDEGHSSASLDLDTGCCSEEDYLDGMEDTSEGMSDYSLFIYMYLFI